MKNRKRGFTLIEIMIVVVILAILATMVLPKMLAAPESAYLAEANAHIGALARAQDTYMQLTGNAAGGCTIDNTQATWSKLGMTMPTGSKYTYTCNATTCTASRTIAGVASTAVFNYVTKVFTSCTGSLSAATDTTRGCVIV